NLASMPFPQAPSLDIDRQRATVTAGGAWQVQALARGRTLRRIEADLRGLPDKHALRWDLSGIAAMDHAGAQVFWNAWNRKRPPSLSLAPVHEALFARLEQAGPLELPRRRELPWWSPQAIHRLVRLLASHAAGFIGLIGQLVMDLFRFVR